MIECSVLFRHSKLGKFFDFVCYAWLLVNFLFCCIFAEKFPKPPDAPPPPAPKGQLISVHIVKLLLGC